MYRSGPSEPPCGTPLPAVTHSVQPFPVATVYLMLRRYIPTNLRDGSPNFLHTSSMNLCGVLGNAPNSRPRTP